MLMQQAPKYSLPSIGFYVGIDPLAARSGL
jgi:hypothetical protein